MNYEFIFTKPNGYIDFELIENALNEEDAKRLAIAKNPLILDNLLKIVPAGINWTLPSKPRRPIDNPAVKSVKPITTITINHDEGWLINNSRSYKTASRHHENTCILGLCVAVMLLITVIAALAN